MGYADDVSLMATSAAGLRDLMKKFKGYIRKKGLELNVKKSKIMICRKEGGRRKKEIFEWEGEEIEIVKEFDYLGYTITQNNGDKTHIKKLVGRAYAVLRKIWSLGERLFKDDFERRMKLFDTLVGSIRS